MNSTLLGIRFTKILAEVGDSPVDKISGNVDAQVVSGVQWGDKSKGQALAKVTITMEHAPSEKTKEHSFCFKFNIIAIAEYELSQEKSPLPEDFDREMTYQLCQSPYILAAQEITKLSRQIGISNINFPLQLRLGELNPPPAPAKKQKAKSSTTKKKGE